MTFAEWIAPTSIEEFFNHYWEKNFLHKDSPPESFDDLFSIRDIERWARSTRDGFFFVLHPVDDTVQIASHQANAVASSSIAKNYKNGLAQILKRVSDWPTLQDFISQTEKFFHTHVGANAFLTPPGARTLSNYICNDNILVLQIEGEQTWELRELTVLQLDLEEKQHLEFSDEWKHRHSNPVIAEVSLRAGEMLYIPRGMPHSANAPERGAGLHLRVYIAPHTWVDFFKTAAEHAAIHSQAMRRSLPAGFVEDDTLRDGMATDFQQLMDDFQNVSFDDVLSAVRRNRVAHQGFPPSDFLGARVDPDELGPDSKVERRPHVLCTVEEITDPEGCPKSALFFGNEQVVGPPGLRRAFQFVRAHERFRISELPGLDAESQLVLARRLVREGLLRPSDRS